MAGCQGRLGGPWFFGGSHCALLSLRYIGTKSTHNGGMGTEQPEFESCHGSRGSGQRVFGVDEKGKNGRPEPCPFTRPGVISSQYITAL